MEIIKKFEPIFGEWYAESFIGAGSFGRVYKIYRDELGERFYSALKYISIPADESEVIQLRLDGMDDPSISTYYTGLTKDITAETRLMSRLRGNTNIVSFEDSKVIPKPDGMGYDIFIRMELLESLPSRLLKATLSVNDTVKLGIGICNALTLCKKFGIIHRDIKLDNIFVSEMGDFKLGDFGIARQLEKTATFMSKKGTYNYMAPEVYKGEKYGATCDLYSLGLVMYRLLNKGRLPFLPEAPNPITANDREEALKRRFTGEKLPAPCNADEELSAIVLKACAYDPKDRFASAEAMRTALLHYGSGEYSDMSGAIMVNDSTEGTEDGPTESVFTDDSSVDTEEDGETLGVLGGIPPVANKAFEQPVQPSEPSVKAQLPQKPAAAPVTEIHKKVNNAANASFSEKKEEKKTGLFIGIASAMQDGVNGRLARKHYLGNKELGSTVSVGDIITFGRYKQANNTSNDKEDIEWLVLAKEHNKILAISDKALDCQQYNTSYTRGTWENCSLRKWMNGTFLNAAFSTEEQAQILSTKISDYKNSNYSTNPGNATTDKVFLLSINEVNKYFSSDEARKCAPTAYAKAQGTGTSNICNTYKTESGEATCWWWLRSPGFIQDFAATVHLDGSVYYRGRFIHSANGGIRPAMWINLGS